MTLTAGTPVQDKYLGHTGVVVMYSPPMDPIVKWDHNGVETFALRSDLLVEV